MDPYTVLDYFALTAKIVHTGPCRVYSVNVAGDGVNGDAQLYDGQGTGGAQKLHIEALSGTSHQWRSAKGVYFDKGIYLVANATTTKVSIEYDPIE